MKSKPEPIDPELHEQAENQARSNALEDLLFNVVFVVIGILCLWVISVCSTTLILDVLLPESWINDERWSMVRFVAIPAITICFGLVAARVKR